MKAPCYLCGDKAVVDGLCSRCYNDQHPLIEIPTPISLRACKKCGAVKVPGGWTKVSSGKIDSDELAQKQIELVLQQEIKFFAPGVTLALEEEKKLDRVSHLLVTAFGKSHEKISPHEEHHPVEIRFSYGTCDTCGMMKGGYYEAILQIRADNREISDKEKDEFTKKVKEMTVAKYNSDNKAFVTMIDDTKHGIDYYIGSEHLAKNIADEFERHYIVTRKENYKLIGEDKTGKKKYRITILIRLPRFDIGDFVRITDQPCQVTRMSRNNLTCYNLERREQFTINTKSPRWRSLEFLAPLEERREYMVVTHVYGKPVQIMDAGNYDVTEVEESVFESEINSGEKVYGIVIDERLYILPDQAEFIMEEQW